jgi:uncharacterized repeat protein (TIGR03803 family)
MTRNNLWATRKALAVATATLIAILVLASGAAAGQYNVLYVFPHVYGGANPYGNLTFDPAGNLYGATWGGPRGFGVVFKLTHNSNGCWTKKVIYTFTGGADGGNPAAGLVMDKAGNLYGTTVNGGVLNEYICLNGTCGVVFKLAPNPDGTWTESVLHKFTWVDGYFPAAKLIFDEAGNLYGTTWGGGGGGCGFANNYYGCGTVFRLKPNPDGTWNESVLHAFSGGEGAGPAGGLIFDTAGNLYGTTGGGGGGGCGYPGCGTVFRLEPNADGSWTNNVLYAFQGYLDGYADGYGPAAGLIFDATGNLYGTTGGGGSGGQYGYGVVFKLTPRADGNWTESVLHSFTGANGNGPLGLIFDSGNLYGMTNQGGTSNVGVVFKVMPNPDGSWTGSVLHNFTGFGEYPESDLTMDKAGNLYGTTKAGISNYGLVFEITP